MAAGDLTTLANLEQYLGVASGDEDEPLLSALISAASAFIQTACGRQFAWQAYTEMRDGTGGQRLFLPNTPVTAVTSLYVGITAVPASSGFGSSSPPSPGYIFKPNGALDLIGYRFHRGNSNVVISYQAGYAPLPADLVQAANELAAHQYREINRLGIQTEAGAGPQGQSQSYVIKDAPPRVQSVINRYTRVVPGYP